MRLLSTWLDYLTSGRIRLDLGQGIILDTDKLAQRDTGWRKVTVPEGVGGNVFIRRLGDEVHMMIQGVTTQTAGHTTIYPLPVGFRPQAVTGANWRNGAATDDQGTSIRPTSYFNGNMRILWAETGKQYGGYFVFLSNDAWPTSIPGTAA